MRLSAKEWREHVNQQSKSRLSPSQYCQSRGIPVANFYYWRAKARAETRLPAMIPVVVKESEPEPMRTSIALPNGIRIAVDVLPGGLAALVNALMGVRG